MNFLPNAASTGLMTDRQIGETLDRYSGRIFLTMVFAPTLVGGLAITGFIGTVLAGGPVWWALAIPCVCAPVLVAALALHAYLEQATGRLGVGCDDSDPDDEVAILRRIKLLTADVLTAYACGLAEREPVTQDLARLQALLSRLERGRDTAHTQCTP